MKMYSSFVVPDLYKKSPFGSLVQLRGDIVPVKRTQYAGDLVDDVEGRNFSGEVKDRFGGQVRDGCAANMLDIVDSEG